MAVNLSAIKAAYKASYVQGTALARQESTIDAALAVQGEVLAEAMRVALETFIAQATVDGGSVPSSGGPITGALIS